MAILVAVNSAKRPTITSRLLARLPLIGRERASKGLDRTHHLQVPNRSEVLSDGRSIMWTRLLSSQLRGLQIAEVRIDDKEAGDTTMRFVGLKPAKLQELAKGDATFKLVDLATPQGLADYFSHPLVELDYRSEGLFNQAKPETQDLIFKTLPTERRLKLLTHLNIHAEHKARLAPLMEPEESVAYYNKLIALVNTFKDAGHFFVVWPHYKHVIESLCWQEGTEMKAAISKLPRRIGNYERKEREGQEARAAAREATKIDDDYGDPDPSGTPFNHL